MAQDTMRGIRILAVAFAVVAALAAWFWACVHFPENTTTIRGIMILIGTGGDAPG